MTWDFEGGGYCCPQCGEPFTRLGDHVADQLDWEVIIRLAVHCRRRYRRACVCQVPATVTAPGPPKAIGKGLFTNAFTAMLLTERCVAGRSQNSLVTGLARHGAEFPAATLTGTCAQAGALLVPLAEAIAARSRDSWHLQVGLHRPRHHVLRHGPGEDGGPRRLVISSDFYSVYQSAGKKADGLVNLYCWAHYPAVFRPGRGREPGPAAVLDAGVAGPDQGPVRRPRHAHRRLVRVHPRASPGRGKQRRSRAPDHGRAGA